MVSRTRVVTAGSLSATPRGSDTMIRCPDRATLIACDAATGRTVSVWLLPMAMPSVSS